MDWKRVPSLAALRAFEAAARTGSLSAAAGALNVTHAAISQHVRALEREVGAELLHRGPRGVEATETGATLAAALSDGFGRIAAGVEAARRARGVGPLRVAVTPTFAENWLMPRIGRFWAAHPEVEVALLPSTALADLAAGKADVAIRSGRGWPGSECLLSARYAVVAAPALAAADPDPARTCWYIEPYSDEIRRFAEAAGLIDGDSCVHEQPSNALTLAAVRAGHGLSAQTLPNVEAELAAGTLVAIRILEETGAGYHLVPAPAPPHPGLKPFAAWLRREAKGVESAGAGA
ncbi:LysR family transcriptional regulator [Hasllibacter halocynthiae]|uniref:LysR family transcriptional regulator n=2 Tax=Hasllibacter halocynthiae TaxID=595589 RepID=A0A2T0X1U3_9RHOB|nr:LysR family transcriptional regulator [Hasllibacter halocynthiae]